MRRQLLIIFAAVALILGAAIYVGTRGGAPAGGKPKVMASFYVLAEFARQVGGGRVDVETMTPSGVEPHDFEPTPQQIKRVFAAQVFLYNGAGLDSWAEKIAKETAKKGVVTRNLSRYVALRKTDPHIWLDPVLAQKEVRVIRDALIKADPKGAAVYRKNATAYIAKLRTLDREYREGLKDCPTREVVSSHAAFGYLARRYNLKVFPIVVSPNEEPASRRIGEISRIVKKKKIEYIFFETLVSPKVAQTIARETGAKTLVFNPIEGLTPKEAALGKDYISLMGDNLKNLRIGLGCQ